MASECRDSTNQTAAIEIDPSRDQRQNVTFELAGTTFIYRGAAVILRGNEVLLGRELQLDFWYLPGGRVLIGEHAEAAVRREVREELRSEPANTSLLWIHENFFAHGDQSFHEIGLYFRVGLPPDAPALGWQSPVVSTDTADGVTEEWRWVRVDALSGIDLRPPFLRDRLARLPRKIEHFVDDRRSR